MEGRIRNEAAPGLAVDRLNIDCKKADLVAAITEIVTSSWMKYLFVAPALRLSKVVKVRSMPRLAR